jgi:hypothetical protein
MGLHFPAFAAKFSFARLASSVPFALNTWETVPLFLEQMFVGRG